MRTDIIYISSIEFTFIWDPRLEVLVLFDFLLFSNSCIRNFSNASSINEFGTFFCDTLILPTYNT